jgi:GH15 family glucan-1,4-alpha-glucosidase
MCWVALESLASLCDIVKMPVSSEAVRSEQKRIRDAIERRGFNASLNSYVDRFDGNQPDASLLVMARTGYIEPGHERMRGTFAFIERKLGVNAQLYRYPPGSDGLPGQEGTFGLAGFWAIDYLARCGEGAQATARFEELLGLANDVGLFAEETDPSDGSALGNFPQAYTHLGVIMAAMSLKERR